MNPLFDSKHFELTASLNKPKYIEKEVQRGGTRCLETLTTKERYSLWTHYWTSESYGHYPKDLNLLCSYSLQRGQLHEEVSVVKGKAIPLQAWTGPEGSRMLRLPDFKTIDRHMKVVRFTAVRTSRLYPQELFFFMLLITVRGWINPKGHSAAGRIVSMVQDKTVCCEHGDNLG
jgi:hypothetical protein